MTRAKDVAALRATITETQAELDTVEQRAAELRATLELLRAEMRRLVVAGLRETR